MGVLGPRGRMVTRAHAPRPTRVSTTPHTPPLLLHVRTPGVGLMLRVACLQWAHCLCRGAEGDGGLSPIGPALEQSGSLSFTTGSKQRQETVWRTGLVKGFVSGFSFFSPHTQNISVFSRGEWSERAASRF